MDISNYISKWNACKTHVNNTYKSLSPERVILFWSLIAISFVLIFSALVVFNNRFLITIPTYGGSIREGIVGTPRFINPVLATSEQDKDLTALVYAGLTKKDELGHTVLDMAESITESDDQLHYSVVLKEAAKFHDGKPVTTDDIMYTISLIQNPSIKSPHRIEWEGVSIEKQNNKELTFSLKKPFPQFMDVLTIGILPKHIWKNLTDEQISLSDYNVHPIGSGPYSIEKITTNSGIPETFTLSAYKHYTNGRPYLNTIIISTYQNEKYLIQAFQNGDIDRLHGISPEKIENLSVATSSIKTSLLPRTFAVFFNPNKASFLSDKNVRLALHMAINKQAIVETVLRNYGKVINDPYPFDEDITPSVYDVEKARTLIESTPSLKKASSTIEITLATANTDEMKKVAEMIKLDWEKIGVHTTLAVYEVSDLNQSVIKDRDFQVLLFGSITQNPSDLYAFWHSSQRKYPGLNISNYVSKKLDINLEILRESDNELARITSYEAVKKEFAEETPGIFLFSPALIYITRDNTTSQLPIYSFDNSSRFTLVENWYRYIDSVWPKTSYKPLAALLENLIH
ncbi:MAG: ABC transporter substrate-binding protein [Candidatus Paceibacterota bacterium]|jgi:peptide/nickel transport system substrate-binding protein